MFPQRATSPTERRPLACEVQTTPEIKILVQRIHTEMGADSPDEGEGQVEQGDLAVSPDGGAHPQQDTGNIQVQEIDAHRTQPQLEILHDHTPQGFSASLPFRLYCTIGSCVSQTWLGTACRVGQGLLAGDGH